MASPTTTTAHLDFPPEVWTTIAAEVALLDPVSLVKDPDYLHALLEIEVMELGILSKEAREFEARGGREPLLQERYMGINRPFFDYYLDRKYHTVQWIAANPMTLHQLERLQTPLVASHVRQLQIGGGFVNSLKDAIDKLPNTEKTSSDLETVVERMITAIHNMQNVVDFEFELQGPGLMEHTEHLLRNASLSLSPNLRGLVLRTPINLLGSTLDMTDFQNLDELRLHLQKQAQDGQDEVALARAMEENARELKKTIAPFINHQKAGLRSLTLESSAVVDLAPLFELLGYFPVLRRLSLNISLQEAYLSNVNTLVNFLERHHEALRHVDIRPYTPDIQQQPGDIYDYAMRRTGTWFSLQRALVRSETALQCLGGLYAPVGDLDSCIALIQRSTQTLTHLSLTDTLFDTTDDNKDLERVLRLFASNPSQLQSIHVEVRYLDLPLLKLLANHLPGLRSLVLLFESVREHDGSMPAGAPQAPWTPTGNWVNPPPNLFAMLSTLFNQGGAAPAGPPNGVGNPQPTLQLPVQLIGTLNNTVALLGKIRALKPGELGWSNLNHITVVSPQPATVSPQDIELLGLVGLPPASLGTAAKHMSAIAKAVESVRSFKGAWYHRRVFQ